MKNTLLITIAILFFSSCKSDDSPRQKRYLDKVEIVEAKMEAWDILSGPDMVLFYRDGLVDSTSNIGGSEIFNDASPLHLPLTFEDVAFEITDYMDFRVLDIDEFAPDQIMFQAEMYAYQLTEEGNPFLLTNQDWKIRIYWKTQ